MKIFYDRLEDDCTPLETGFSFEDTGEAVDIKDFSGELIKAGGFYFLRGHIDMSLKTKCDRCMEDTVIKINSDLSVCVHPQKDEMMSRAEYEMNDADGDIYFTGPEYMDLHDILRQEALLMVPSRKICGANCSGLVIADTEDDSEEVKKNTPLKGLSLLKKDPEEK